MSELSDPVVTPHETPGGLRPPWQPGQSGNPSGRPRRKPITDLVLEMLDQPARGRSGKSRRQLFVERLYSIALSGKRAESLAAMKLLWAYAEGHPTQPVELDIVSVVRQIAAERGLSEADTDRAIAETRRILEEAKQRGAGQPVD